jgi:indolepyruvate ferredoxin oxidoreductase alpha subunit
MDNPEVLAKAGREVVLLGNEAIARGALEAGLGFSACYPGTPSSEVGTTLADIAKETKKIYYEWSTNEKVAFEATTGAAWCGVRSITAVKHFGFNVASDSVFPVVFTGVKAGMVFVVADDPEGHSSAQSEQDARYMAKMGYIPVIEPSSPQECLTLTKKAFEVSEKYEIPVILRTTTMVSHATGSVRVGKIKPGKSKGRFVKDFDRYMSVKPNLQKMHLDVLKKIDMIEKQYAGLNSVEGSGKVGIITSGVSYEHIKELGLKNIKVAKLRMTFPISRTFVSSFLKGLKTVIVVEELEPFIEEFVRMVAKDANPGVKVYGKDILPRTGEFTPNIILDAIAPIVGAKRHDFRQHERNLARIKIPSRMPVLCAGCPHRSTFYAVKKVMGNKTVYAGDIGCYILGMYKPFETVNFFLSMGASMGLTHGINKVSKQKVVAFIGDSTFFHASMPGLANLVYNDPKPLIIVMDNAVTAMTGHQPHPGTGWNATGQKTQPINIEQVVRSFGIKNVRTVNCYNQKEMQSTIKEFNKKNELSVIVAKGMCMLLKKKLMKKAKQKQSVVYEVDPKKAKGCKDLEDIACPAIEKCSGNYTIKKDVCAGCGACVQLCPGRIRAVPNIMAKKPVKTKPKKGGKK